MEVEPSVVGYYKISIAFREIRKGVKANTLPGQLALSG
jgi:hypothetical protein